MTIVPFDPNAQRRSASLPSLQSAYPLDDLRAFVAKLRELADVSPATCGRCLHALDRILEGMVDQVRSEAPRRRDQEPRTLGSYRRRQRDHIRAELVDMMKRLDELP